MFLEAVVLAGLPLFSRASIWGGAPGATWPELLAVPVWIAAILRGRRAWVKAGRGAWPAIALYGGAVLASVLVVLFERHRIDSSVFAANLSHALREWFGAWSTAAPLYSLRSAAIYAVGPIFFVAVRAIWATHRPRLFERLIVWGGAAAAALAVAQAALGRGLFVETAPGEPSLVRAAGPLPDPNAFGSYLALTAAFGAVVWAARLREDASAATTYRVGAALWALLIAAGLWVSGSRAALFTLLCLLIVLLSSKVIALRGRDHAAVRWATVGAVVVVVLAGMTAYASLGEYGTVPSGSLWHRFLSPFDVGQSAMRLFRGRPVLWQAGLTMIVDEPVTGVGAGRYGVELGGRLPVELWGVATAENAHNYFLQTGAETGLVGLGALGLLLAVAGGALWTARAEVRARAALLGAAAWCLTCVVGHPQLIPSLQLFFWGFLGMATAGRPLPRLGPGRAGLVLILVFLVGRVGQEVLSTGWQPSLYAAGLHQREPTPPGGESLRWATSRARMDLRKDGDVVQLRFFVAHQELPVTVHSAVGPWSEERRFYDGGWKTLAYYVPPDGSGRVGIAVETEPPFVAAGDPRDLGVMLAPPRWQRGLPSEPIGAYDLEVGDDGRSFRWTSGVGCFPVARGQDIELSMRAANPDLVTNPLVVTLLRAGTAPETVSIGHWAWQTVRVTGGESAGPVLCIRPSRTWNPRAEQVSADARDLGVAVSILRGDGNREASR